MRREPDFDALRARMVAEQVESRGIHDERVLEAMGKVPREAFTDADDRKRAYEDIPIQIGWGQTISQPYMVALICEEAAVRRGARVLDVGGVPATRPPCSRARRRGALGWNGSVSSPSVRARKLTPPATTTCKVHLGDGSLGDPDHGPFDAGRSRRRRARSCRARALRPARGRWGPRRARRRTRARAAAESWSRARRVRRLPIGRLPLRAPRGPEGY